MSNLPVTAFLSSLLPNVLVGKTETLEPFRPLGKLLIRPLGKLLIGLFVKLPINLQVYKKNCLRIPLLAGFAKGFAVLFGLMLPGLLLAQPMPDKALLGQPGLYKVLKRDAGPPVYFSTGQTACLLAWPPNTFLASEASWRMRVLDAASMALKLEIRVDLEPNLELLLSEEAKDRMGTYLLFKSGKQNRHLVLMYLRYADGNTEVDRFTMPLGNDPDLLLVSPLGAYVRAEVDDIPVMFHLSPETHRATVLPFGPDKAYRLVGAGLEPATGRLWVALARKGRNPGPVPLVARVYSHGEALAQMQLKGFALAEGPTQIYLASDSLEGLWLGFWGGRGSDFAQGVFAMQGGTLLQRYRFVDSARYFNTEKPRVAERRYNKYSRRKGYRLTTRYYSHPPVQGPDGTFLLGAERYFIRQANNYSPFANPMGMYMPNNSYRYYETDGATVALFAPDGGLRQLYSIRVPSQTHDLPQACVTLLPDRPPLFVDNNTPKLGLANTGEPGLLSWIILQPAALGLPIGLSVSVDRILDDGPIAYATGQAKGGAEGSFWFVARLPAGK